MTDLIVIGAGKFAVEVAGYIDDVTASGQAFYRITCYLAVEGEAVHVPADSAVPLEGFHPPAGATVVVAISDVAQRRAVMDGFVAQHAPLAENIVHPTASVDRSLIEGTGNIIGPNCYLGARVTLGSFNVINYHCTIGNHSSIGANNFIAPNFHCGNSVEIGDNNFFGLSCTLAPEVVVGSDCRFSAGLTVFDPAKSGHSYLQPSRIKAIRSFSGGDE